MAQVITSGSSLLQILWDEELEKFVDHGDPLSGMAGMVSGNMKAPEACVFKVKLQPKVGKYVLKLRMPLAGAGYVGGSSLTENTGERMRLKDMQTYIEQYGTVVNLDTPDTVQGHLLGNDVDSSAAQDAMKDWGNHKVGKLKRQALLQMFDSNLVDGGMWGLAYGLNPNIYIDGLATTDQPTYSATLATYTASLYAALNKVTYGAGGFNDANNIIAASFNKLQTFTKFQRRVIAAQGSYDGRIPLLVHPYAAQYLRDLANVNSLASLRRTTLSTDIARLAFDAGADIGEQNNFSLMEDPRAPIVEMDTSAGTLTFVYRDVGETDQRASHVNTATKRIFLVNIGLGKGALVHSQALAWKYADQLKDIGMLEQIRGGAIEGFHARKYDEPVTNDVTDATDVQQYSVVQLTQSGSMGGVPA